MIFTAALEFRGRCFDLVINDQLKAGLKVPIFRELATRSRV